MEDQINAKNDAKIGLSKQDNFDRIRSAQLHMRFSQNKNTYPASTGMNSSK